MQTFSKKQKSDFIAAYLECAAWSSINYETENTEDENYDENFEGFDFSERAKFKAAKICLQFIKDNKTLLIEYAEKQGNEQWSAFSLAGHDLWLTSQGHGAGFWDRGLGELGDKLSTASGDSTLNLWLNADELIEIE